MKKSLKTIILLTLIAFASGCTTPYMMDRKRDALDICTFTTGMGGGAKCRVGPIQAGLFFNTDYEGIRGGAHIYKKSIGKLPVRTEDMDMTATLPILPTHGGFGLHSIEMFGDAEVGKYYRKKQFKAGGAIIPGLVVTMSGADNIWGCLTSSPSYYTQIDIAGGLVGTIRFGLNPGELLDFLCGWFYIDIYGDDIGESVIPSLIKKLESENEEEREFGVEGLGKLIWIMTEEEQHQSVKALIKILENPKDSSLHYEAMRSLWDISKCNRYIVKSAIPIIIEKLKDKYEFNRSSAAMYLGFMKAEEAVPALIEALNDKEKDVRKEVGYVLYTNFQSCDTAIPGLVKLLKSSSDERRAYIVSILGKFAGAEPVLIELLNDPDVDIRYWALHELQYITPFPMKIIPKVSEFAKEKGVSRLSNLAKDILRFRTDYKD